MDKISEIRRLWRDRFNDSRNWMTNVFPRIYRDDEALVIPNDTGEGIISMLLLRRYQMSYRGRIFPVGYIYGAATSRQKQGQGYMSSLVRDALREAYTRGDVMVALQPARRRLYGFYDRFGFSTTFYIREERYTSKHKFLHDDTQYIIELSGHDPGELAAAYQRLTSQREGNMLHSEDDFKTILIDCDLDNNCLVTARSVTSGHIVAIAMAGLSFETIAIREIVYNDEDAASAVLDAISEKYPQKMTVVEAYPKGYSRARLFSRGMARIVNVQAFLEILAEINPELVQNIRIRDSLLCENSGIFQINKGKVSKYEGNITDLKIDLDVDISVLTSIAFSPSHVGEIFSLPTARPFMSMMLS